MLNERAEASSGAEARPAQILLLSPPMTDDRVWGAFVPALAGFASVSTASWPGHGPGEAPLPAVVDASSAIEEIADQVIADTGRLDVVLVVRQDATAAMHLAQLGRVRGVVMVEPMFTQWPENYFDVQDEEIQKPDEEFFAALGAAVESGDPGAFGEAAVIPERDLLGSHEQDIVRQVAADNVEAGLAGPDWLTYAPDALDALTRVEVPVLVVVPEREIGALAYRTGQFFVEQIRDARLATISSRSQYPWLADPGALAAHVSDFLDHLTG